ncbi:hypothetical protein [Psychrobacter aquimaris]|uniref:hypothetical protein n=1 Tax=Psychrobacter aquimaris TaxID=292733 RepID=UPI003FD5DBC9
MKTYQIELTQSEINNAMTALLSHAIHCRNRNYDTGAIVCERVYDRLYETSCPALAPVPSTDKGGASSLSNLDLFDDDLPPIFGGE